MALRWQPEAASAGFAGTMAGVAGIVILGVFAIGFAALALRPAIEIHETHLVTTSVLGGVTGRRAIPWERIRRVDHVFGQARWQQIPWLKGGKVLAVILTLEGGDRLLVVHAGGSDSGRSLLGHLRRSAREALLDGIPYRRFWGQGTSEQPRLERLRSEHARPEYARPEVENSERTNPERAPSRSRLGDTAPDPRRVPPRYPLLLAEDEAEIEHMFQRLKAAGRLDPQRQDTRGDASLDSRASGEGQG
jgi:hypothetical protein